MPRRSDRIMGLNGDNLSLYPPNNGNSESCLRLIPQIEINLFSTISNIVNRAAIIMQVIIPVFFITDPSRDPRISEKIFAISSMIGGIFRGLSTLGRFPDLRSYLNNNACWDISSERIDLMIMFVFSVIGFKSVFENWMSVTLTTIFVARFLQRISNDLSYLSCKCNCLQPPEISTDTFV